MRATFSRRLALQLFMAAILAMMLLFPQADAATSQTINYTEDFVDATSNLHLATPDLGTHSVFGDLQDYGANYDQMQEVDTGGAGFNLEDFVDTISDLHPEDTDIGTHAGGGFVEMQDKDGTYDLLTEANTGGAGVNEYRFVDLCPALLTWSSTGTTPFLGAVDASNIHTTGTTGWSVWIEFAETSGSGTGFTVNMSTYVDNTDADELLDWELDWTGDSVADASGSWTPTATPSWWNSGTVSGLDTQTEIDACTIRYQTTKGGAGPGTTTIDAARLGISQAGGANYDLDLEVGWTTADNDETNEYLCIFGGTQGAEALRVDIWDDVVTNDWVNMFTDIAAGWNNISLNSGTDYLDDAGFEVRFTDTTGDAVEADTWQIEGVMLHVWTAGASNYELDLEVGWSTVDYDETVEELCIYPITGGGWPAEEIHVEIWDGAWTPLFTDLTPDQWNNISISSYLAAAAVEVRFLGGTETGDTTQDTFEIDAVLIQTYSTAYTEVRYEEITIDETDYQERGVSKTLFEGITIDETDTEQIVIGKLLFESITMDETLTTILDAAAVLYESITTDETISTAAAIISILFESVALAATGYFNKIIQKFLFEGVTVSVTLGSVLTASRTLFESVTISDTRNTSAAISRTLFEAITIDETVYPESGLAEELYLFESITINETIYPQIIIQKFLFESVAINETDIRILSISRTLFESITASDTMNTTANITRILFESITIDETVTAIPSAGLTELYLFETVTFDETDLIGVIRGAFLYESITINKSMSATLDASISLFESITINETIDNLFTGEYILNLFESFNYGENDVWGPYRPEPVEPGGGGVVPIPPVGGEGPLAAVYNLVPFAIVVLISGGVFYISKIQPEKLKGERELVLKGMKTLTRTGRTIRRPLKRAKKKIQNSSKIRVRKARPRKKSEQK